MAFSTAMAEDYVGRTSVISRTTHQTAMPLRTAQKWLPRGLMLSLSIVAAGDSPYVQMLLIVSVMLCYMIVQLMTWPWKLPALNAFDATISAALIMMMAILGAFAPDLSTGIQSRLTTAVLGIVLFLNGIVCLMLCVTVSSLVRIQAMGGSQESTLLALGRIPKPSTLSEKLHLLCNRIEDLGEAGLTEVLKNLSIYDLRMAAQIVTVGEKRLVLSRRSQLMSTNSNIDLAAVQKLATEMESAEEEPIAEQKSLPPAVAESSPSPENALAQKTETAWL
eukprot:s5198_g6.t1